MYDPYENEDVKNNVPVKEEINIEPKFPQKENMKVEPKFPSKEKLYVEKKILNQENIYFENKFQNKENIYVNPKITTIDDVKRLTYLIFDYFALSAMHYFIYATSIIGNIFLIYLYNDRRQYTYITTDVNILI